ncbi:MAG: hypothetical protein LBV71_20100 [Prevotella sp.]|nr:hypothetical protein [Prevotella sp.]
MKISFTENILYWLWFYFKRMGARFPFMVAQMVLAILILSNLMSVGVISFFIYSLICNMIDVPHIVLNTERIVIALIIMYISVLSYVLLRYNDKKYCTVKKHRILIWHDKYCILADYYDSITPEQVRKHLGIFCMYLSISLLAGLICIIQL